ncbi:MAG: glutamate synthase subunit beta [Lachnospiraceae bacterium]|nr:glutamate synthase subunit beta [Lachnospiraceae bacterium]
MGKATGFMEYTRQENREILPEVRTGNFLEFHEYAAEKERICQAARCMDCGVPFCQSAMKLKGMVTGCPLHNLIPEWNDAIYKGHDTHALMRLLKTNPFPEFTGRVCPALCEKACINGQYGDPVTIHDNELYIIEKAYEKGTMAALPPEVRSGKKAAVIGSGPSGLAVAYKLNRRGHEVTVYERDDRIGGLLMYGIPNMKLDKKVILRRQKILEEEGIVFKTGVDVGKDVTVEELKKEYDAVILCCGAKKPRPLAASGIEDVKGVYYAVDFLGDVTRGVLSGKIDKKLTSQVEGKHVVIVGGGDTGNDCIGTVIRMGASSVTAIEMMPKPPVERREDNPWPEWPKTLRTDYGHVEAIWKFGDDPRVYETTVKEVVSDKGVIKAVKTVKVAFEGGKLTEVSGTEKEIKCDLLLIAAGFIGAQDYLPDSARIERTQRGTVKTCDEDSYATNLDGVFTAGDMHRGQSLVVWAIREGIHCATEVDRYLMGYTNL